MTDTTLKVLEHYRILDEPRLWAVVFEDHGTIVIQGLEYDIGAFGPDVEIAKQRMKATVQFEKEHSLERTGKFFKGIDPAPQKFFDMAYQCTSGSKT